MNAAAAGVNAIVANGGSNYAGNLEITAPLFDSDDFDVLWTVS